MKPLIKLYLDQSATEKTNGRDESKTDSILSETPLTSAGNNTLKKMKAGSHAPTKKFFPNQKNSPSGNSFKSTGATKKQPATVATGNNDDELWEY